LTLRGGLIPLFYFGGNMQTLKFIILAPVLWVIEGLLIIYMIFDAKFRYYYLKLNRKSLEIAWNKSNK
jgi:hypothetical protein